MQPLFIQAHIDFEKTAAEVDLPEDPNSWAKEVLDELYKQVPYIADFKPHVVMTKVDAERAYGFGHVEVSNQSEAQMGTDPNAITAAGIRTVRVPVIIKDGKLSPFDIIVTDTSKVIPLTESRLRQSLFRPQMFDVTSQTPGDQSMIGQLYPPYRQNYGFGGGGVTVPGMGMGKSGSALTKTASAFEEFLFSALEKKDAGFRKPPEPEEEKTAAFEGVKNFGRLLKANPNSAELEKAFKSYEKKTGKSRKEMSMGDQLEHLKAVRGGSEKTASALFHEAAKRRGLTADVREAREAAGRAAKQKTSSVIDAILPTINHSDLDQMWDRIGKDVNLQVAMRKNAHIIEPLGKLVAPEAPGVEKTAAALPYMLRPTVVQIVKQPEGYLTKTANHDYWKSFTQTIDRGELVQRFGAKLAQAVDSSGAVTLADDCTAMEKKAEPELSPIVDDGLYKVMTVDGEELVGWVIPNLLDTDGESLPLAIFTNGSQATIQDEIFGEPVGEGAALPSGPPSGYGAFYTVDQKGVRMTIPMTLGGSHQMPNQPSTITGETYDGRPLEVSIQPNIQELTPMEEGKLLIPEHWLWLPLDGAADVALAGGTQPQAEGSMTDAPSADAGEESPPDSTEGVKESMAWIDIRSDGQSFSFNGPALHKLSAAETQFLDIDDAMFLMAGLGIEQGFGATKLAHATTGTHPVRLRIGRLIKTAAEQERDSHERARALLNVVPNLRQDLLKEATAIPDPTAVDTVLSLGFINPENLMTFVSYLPAIDDAQAKMCELLLTARIGLKNIPTSALERSVRATEEVIEGLKIIAFQN